MNPRLLIGIVVALIVVGAAGWFAIHTPAVAAELGLNHPQHMQGQQGPIASSSRMRSGMNRGGFATGSIEVLTDNGFTLTLQDGSTKNVAIMATTTLMNYASTSSTPATTTTDQLSVGEQVRVTGTANADGSITARRVDTGSFPAYGAGGMRGPRAQGQDGTPPQQ